MLQNLYNHITQDHPSSIYPFLLKQWPIYLSSKLIIFEFSHISSNSQQLYNKTKNRRMHFNKYQTPPQMYDNSQINSGQPFGPFFVTNQYQIESGSPTASKIVINQYTPTTPPANLESHKFGQTQLFQQFCSGFCDPLGVPIHKPSKVKGFPLDPQLQRLGISKYTHHVKRKHSQNNIIQENETIYKQADLKRQKYQPIKTSQITESKFLFKPRKASCNLQSSGFFNKFSRQNSDQSSQLDLPRRQRPVIKKKSHGWDQNKNFQLGSSNPASDGKSHEETQKNMLLELPKIKNLRKRSLNLQAPVLQVPSFLTKARHHRNSIDVVELQQTKKIAIQDFIIIKQLGKGSFGRVVLAAQRQSRMICAIKIMSKRDIREKNMVQQLIRELKIQMLVNHPNIVKIYGFFDDLLHFYILIECALDGHLNEFIQKTPNPIPQTEAGIMIKQICSAVSLLHSQSIIHRDLKLQNVLLHESVVKICDFGWSVKRDAKLRSTFCGTPLYLCPQILVGDEYDESVDIWAIGVIMYQMTYKTNPFRIKKGQDLINILNSPIDFKEEIPISKMARDFIEICLSKRAVQRPNIKELLIHELILTAQSDQKLKQKQ